MLKRAISSLAVRRFVREANVLIGARFKKAYQIDFDTLVLRFAIRKEHLQDEDEVTGEIRKRLLSTPAEEEGLKLDGEGGNYARADLYFNMGGYIFISPRVNREMPKEPSPFAMNLRKSLRNRVLESVEQVGMDRLLALVFSPGKEEDSGPKLYLELFGDGNAILVKGGRIVYPFTSRTWSSRTVKRGELFLPPPGGIDPSTITLDAFAEMAGASGDDLVHFLIRVLKLPPIYAEEVCLLSGKEKSTQVADLGEGGLKEVYDSMSGILEDVESGSGGYVHFSSGDPQLVEPVIIRSFFGSEEAAEAGDEGAADAGRYHKRLGSLSLALEEYMFETTVPLPKKERERVRGVERLERLLKGQEKALVERIEEGERYHRLADAIYMNYKPVSEILEAFDPLEEVPGRFPEVVFHTPGKQGGRGSVEIMVNTGDGEERVVLDLDLKINQNADVLYQKSKRARKKAQGVQLAIEMTRKKLEKAREMVEAGECRKPPLRRFWFEGFRWCFSSEGILMLAGRDARTNERIVKKYLRDSDLYAHADIQGAPSVVIRNEKDRTAGDETRRQGCHLSVLCSKAWRSKIGATEAYWVLPDQVSRTPQSGEFLPKGSFMIRGKKNNMGKLELVGAVGLLYLEGVPKAMFGPEEAVSSMCKGSYFRVRPGGKKKTDVAKMVAKDLGGDLDQVLSVLPPDDMTVELVGRKNV